MGPNAIRKHRCSSSAYTMGEKTKSAPDPSGSYRFAQVLFFYGSRIRARSKVSQKILDGEECEKERGSN
jgi:hypothetical protein